jgi:prepilin-type N-terminal cleavage/methylation domain-containing protein
MWGGFVLAHKWARNQGFTLLELLVVLAILAILGLIVVPNLVGIIARAQVAADKANLRTLDTATQLYALDRQIVDGDVFAGIDTDAARIQTLVDANLLAEAPRPKQKGVVFQWNIDAQSWEYANADGTTTTSDTTIYRFGTLSLDGFRKTGIWSESDAGFYSGWGLLFIENELDEYTVTTQAQLAEGTVGGYGILIDTTLTDSNLDSGYVVQFDRGYGAIVVRKRTNGSEGNTLLAVTNSINPLIPASKRSTWWTDEHQFSVSVSNADTAGTKLLTVTIDGETVISNWSFQSSGGDYTGMRSWGAGTTYTTLSIKG